MTEPAGAPPHYFVAPPLDGPVTGGTLYNRELALALRAAGVGAERLDLPSAARALEAGRPGWYWVDSLFLEALPELVRENRGRRPLGVLAHYLPSLVARGDALAAAELSAAEAFALARASVLLAPSAFLADKLRELGASITRVLEPGRSATGLAREAPELGVRAAIVANLVPGKGIAPFLAALGDSIASGDELGLTILGDPNADPSYAAECRAAVGTPALRDRVHFAGAVAPSGVVAELARSHFAISASRMESFGMALAEARTLGVPIVACRGGNVARLVHPASGGELADGAPALARAVLALARDPVELQARRERARRRPLPPRAWSAVARELTAIVQELPEAARASCP